MKAEILALSDLEAKASRRQASVAVTKAHRKKLAKKKYQKMPLAFSASDVGCCASA